MFLSRLTIKSSPDAYVTHQNVSATLPQTTGRYLYRIEKMDNKLASVLLLSQDKPNAETSKSFDPEIQNGMVFMFRLRANPTYRRKSDGKRLAIFNAQKKIEWLNKNRGFITVNCDAKDEGYVYGMKDGNEIKLGATLFEGSLKVIDVDRFKQSLFEGIGSAKGFGFGLLSIARCG